MAFVHISTAKLWTQMSLSVNDPSNDAFCLVVSAAGFSRNVKYCEMIRIDILLSRQICHPTTTASLNKASSRLTSLPPITPMYAVTEWSNQR
jgi:hypothetical protein